MIRYITAWILVASVALGASPVRVIRTVDTREPASSKLTLLHGETIDLQVRLLNYGEAIDLTGYTIALHGQTNGQSAAEAYVAAGVAGTVADPTLATSGWASVAVDVDAWWPADVDTGTWTLLATSSNEAYRVVRAGGPLTLGGTAAASAIAPAPVTVANILAALSASGTVWRAEWVAGDAAGSAARLDLAVTVSNSFLRVYDSGGGVWKHLLPGETAP